MNSYANNELQVEVRNHVAYLTLNRPAALNALTPAMLAGISELFTQWAHDPNIKAVISLGAGEKAYCAGGDVRGLHASLTAAGGKVHDEFFRVEYALNYQMHRFLKTSGKPYIAMIDGIVMGGGMGIAQGATLRIVGERTKMAMPETAIGLFPDVGGSYFLSRCPGAIGLYLGLTGVTIKAADAIHASLADLYLSRAAQLEFFAGLDALQWSDNPLRDVAQLAKSRATNAPETASLLALQPAIEEHFANKPSVAAIISSLQQETRPPFSDWAQQTITRLQKHSPTLLCVTKRQIETAATMKLADCFRMELTLIEQCFTQRDVVEGIRALLIDKDNQPRWNPATLAEVTPAMVDAFFAPKWSPAQHPLQNLEAKFG